MKFTSAVRPVTNGAKSAIGTKPTSANHQLPLTRTQALPQKMEIQASGSSGVTMKADNGFSAPSASLKSAPTMSARGPGENSYATISSDFQSKLSSKVTTGENFMDVIKGATPLSYPVNGKRPQMSQVGFGGNRRQGRRSLVVMNAMPKIEGATGFDIINDHYDR